MAQEYSGVEINGSDRIINEDNFKEDNLYTSNNVSLSTQSKLQFYFNFDKRCY